MKQVLRAAVVVTAVLASGCGGDSTTGPEDRTITGDYAFSLSISNTSLATSCQGVGDVTFTQQNIQFSGTAQSVVTCTGPGGQIIDQGTSPVTGGVISGSQVSFQFNLFESGCNATGTMSGSPINRLNGTATCTLDVSGQTVQLTGTWQASR